MEQHEQHELSEIGLSKALVVFLLIIERRIMATLQDVKDTITALSTAQAQAFTDVNNKITALQNQINQGGTVTSADLDTLKASLQPLIDAATAEDQSVTGSGGATPPATSGSAPTA